MSEKEQRKLILLAKQKCYKLSKLRERENQTEGQTCHVTWDSMLCWDRTPADSVTSQPCPNYVNGFNTHELATKSCTKNGTWWVNPDPEVKHEWTNFSDCVKPAIDLSFHASHGDQLRLLYTTGYSFSLGALVIAIIIILWSKRLHSKSNILHINLFLAFTLRAAISFLKDILFVGNVGLAKDVKKGKDNILEFVQDDPHWECKLLFTIFTYTVNACNMWIFVEALYLSMLVSWPLTTERRGVRHYVVLGWTLPLIFIVPWVIVKATWENTFCWNIQDSPQYYWIIKGSGIAVIVINFLMFLNIFRKLFLKLRHTAQIGTNRNSKYRKLAKFILVLIPLFGVMYIVFYVAMPSNFVESDFNLAYMYLEMGYNSFQGFFLALLFCFLNEEVHAEVRRAWYRYNNRRRAQASFDKSNGSYTRGKYSINTNNISCSKTQKGNVKIKSNQQTGRILLELDTRNMGADYSSQNDAAITMMTFEVEDNSELPTTRNSEFHDISQMQLSDQWESKHNSPHIDLDIEDKFMHGCSNGSTKRLLEETKKSEMPDVLSQQSTSCLDVESRQIVHETTDSVFYDLSMKHDYNNERLPEVTARLLVKKQVRNTVITNEKQCRNWSLFESKREKSNGCFL